MVEKYLETDQWIGQDVVDNIEHNLMNLVLEGTISGNVQILWKERVIDKEGWRGTVVVALVSGAGCAE